MCGVESGKGKVAAAMVAACVVVVVAVCVVVETARKAWQGVRAAANSVARHGGASPRRPTPSAQSG